MKHKFLTFFLFCALFLNDFMLFAQPGTDDGSGGLEDGDPPPAPINSKLFFLGITGIVFALYFYKKHKLIKN